MSSTNISRPLDLRGRVFGTHRFSEAARIASLAAGKTAAMVCGDFNGVSADRRPDGQFYDPDPLAERGWHDAATFQAAWDDDPDAPIRVDRRAAERLRRAGLIDAACHLGVPWEASSGHWPGDPHGPRRVDRFLASADLAAGLATHRVWRTPAALGLSDHLPVVIGLDEVALR